MTDCTGCQTLRAEVERLRGEVGEVRGRTFPIQRAGHGYARAAAPSSVPWSVAEKAYAAYAAKWGGYQTIERLAERGGFGPEEMDEFYPPWRDEVEAITALRAQLATLTRERDEARGVWRSLAGMLGWANNPPREWLERSLNAERERARAEAKALREAGRDAQARLCEARCLRHEVLSTSHIAECQALRAALAAQPLPEEGKPERRWKRCDAVCTVYPGGPTAECGALLPCHLHGGDTTANDPTPSEPAKVEGPGGATGAEHGEAAVFGRALTGERTRANTPTPAVRNPEEE